MYGELLPRYGTVTSPEAQVNSQKATGHLVGLIYELQSPLSMLLSTGHLVGYFLEVIVPPSKLNLRFQGPQQ